MNIPDMDLCAIRFNQLAAKTAGLKGICTKMMAEMTSHVPQSSVVHTQPSLQGRWAGCHPDSCQPARGCPSVPSHCAHLSVWPLMTLCFGCNTTLFEKVLPVHCALRSSGVCAAYNALSQKDIQKGQHVIFMPVSL